MSNQIISSRIAIVNGEQTALAGCNNASCAKECMRKDSRLAYKENQNVKNGKDCRYFIEG
jgi:hypothetical protein